MTHCVYKKDVIYYIRNASNDYGKGMEMGNVIDCQEKIKELRERTGMSRKDFCDYFQIPYRTVTDWESGKRHAPDYLIRLLEYYIQLNLVQKKNKQEEDANNNGEEND